MTTPERRTTPRPLALAVQVDNIPPVLRAAQRWVNWHYVWREHEGKKGRWIKLPSGKTNDPTTWTAFTVALAAMHRFDGIGFCLGDGWAGLDFDHCRNTADLEIDKRGRLAFEQLDCYAEISPSGTGYKAIGRSHRIGGEVNFAVTPPAATTWQSGRFFTITGQGKGDPLVDISGLIDHWFPNPPVLLSKGGGYRLAAETPDNDLLLQMIGSDNGDKVLALWRGDTSAFGGDHSRADLALVCHLAFWTDYDMERVDRLFRESGLMRDKWRKTASYRRSTLNKAFARRPEAVVGDISYE